MVKGRAAIEQYLTEQMGGSVKQQSFALTKKSRATRPVISAMRWGPTARRSPMGSIPWMTLASTHGRAEAHRRRLEDHVRHLQQRHGNDCDADAGSVEYAMWPTGCGRMQPEERQTAVSFSTQPLSTECRSP